MESYCYFLGRRCSIFRFCEATRMCYRDSQQGCPERNSGYGHISNVCVVLEICDCWATARLLEPDVQSGVSSPPLTSLVFCHGGWPE